MRSFLGRDHELTSLAALPPGAVVCVTGSGGAGKTRLLREHANTHGCLFIEFVAARTLNDVLSVLSNALRIVGRIDGPEALARTIDAHGAQRLVLDNLEQLDAAACEFLGAVAAAVSTPVIATSRRPLPEPFVETLPLGPLNIEDAATLMCRRAHWDPDLFGDVREDSPAILSICAALDRLPLVVELAAGALRFMTAEELATDLAAELSSASQVAGPTRHRSLAESLRWSVGLLSPNGRAALWGASAFTGGFTHRQLERVLPLRAPDVRAALGELIDASLVHYVPDAEQRRLRIFESARAPIVELDASSVQEAKLAHAQLFTELSVDWSTKIRGPEEADAMRWVRRERDNLRTAWDVLEQGRGAAFVELAVALAEPLRRLGPNDLVDRALQSAAEVAHELGDAATAARLQLRRAHLLGTSNDDELVCEVLDAIADDAPQDVLSEKLLVRALLPRLGVTHPAEERLRGLEEAEALAGDAHPWLQICAHGMQSTALLALDREDDAYERLRAALARAEEYGSPSLLVRLRIQLARMERRAAGPSAAAFLVEQAERDARAAGETPFELEAMLSRASLLYDDGKADAALALYAEATVRGRRAATAIVVDVATVGAAAIQLMRGQFDDVLRTLADAPAIRSEFFAAIGTGIELAAHGALGRVNPDEPRFADVARRLTDVGRRHADEFADVFRAYAVVAAAGLAELPAARAAAVRLTEIEDDRDIEILADGVVRFANERMPDGPRLDVATDTTWFRVDDEEHVDLSTRHVLRRLLGCLVDAALSGRSDVTLHELVAAGWPGEIIESDAAASRVYTSIRYLRKLGLRELIIRAEEGYTIEPRASVRRLESGEAGISDHLS